MCAKITIVSCNNHEKNKPSVDSFLKNEKSSSTLLCEYVCVCNRMRKWHQGTGEENYAMMGKEKKRE